MTKTFKAQVEAFADLTKQNMRYVAASAIQDVMEAAQTPQPSVKRTGGTFETGKIPVDTSELINSLASSVNGSFGPTGSDSYTVAIAGFEIGDSMKFAWTAEHALAIEAGTSKIAGRHFVGQNAARFSQFVESRANEVRR